MQHSKYKKENLLTYFGVEGQKSTYTQHQHIHSPNSFFNSSFASERPQVRTLGHQIWFLPRAPSNLVTPLDPLCGCRTLHSHNHNTSCHQMLWHL